MKTTTYIIIDTEKAPAVNVTAGGTDKASIAITARSMQEAADLLCQGEAAAVEACKSWEPKPAPEPAAPAVEIDDKTARRFERASAFSKRNNAYLSTTDFLYCKRMDRADGLVAMFDLAYMKGYEAARRNLRRSWTRYCMSNN